MARCDFEKPVSSSPQTSLRLNCSASSLRSFQMLWTVHFSPSKVGTPLCSRHQLASAAYRASATGKRRYASLTSKIRQPLSHRARRTSRTTSGVSDGPVPTTMQGSPSQARSIGFATSTLGLDLRKLPNSELALESADPRILLRNRLPLTLDPLIQFADARDQLSQAVNYSRHVVVLLSQMTS